MFSIPIGLYISYVIMKKLVGKYLQWSILIPLSLLTGIITALIMTTLSSLLALFFSYFQEAFYRPGISQSLILTLFIGLAIYPIACLIILPFLRKKFIKKHLLKRVRQQQALSIDTAVTNNAEMIQSSQTKALDKIAEGYKNKHAEKHHLHFQNMKSAYVDVIQGIAGKSLFKEGLPYREALGKEVGTILYTLFEYSLHLANSDRKRSDFDPILSAEIILGDYWIPFILTECQLEHSAANKKLLMEYLLSPSSNQYRILFAKIISHEQSGGSDSEVSQLKQKLYHEFLKNCTTKNNLPNSSFSDFALDPQFASDNCNDDYVERVEIFSEINLRLYRQVSGV